MFPIKDISQSLLDEVKDSLKNYLVALYVPLDERPPRPRPIGSGTLVQIEGTHHILTAYHVWHETRGAEQIGLVLTDHQSAFMPINAISVKELWGGKISEWGPDIALLRIPPFFVSTIEARKSFLNLAQQKDSFATSQAATKHGLSAVTGMVGEFTEIQANPEEIGRAHV